MSAPHSLVTGVTFEVPPTLPAKLVVRINAERQGRTVSVLVLVVPADAQSLVEQDIAALRTRKSDEQQELLTRLRNVTHYNQRWIPDAALSETSARQLTLI